MSIKLGSTGFSGIYLGSTKIGSAYLGNVKVYSSAPAGAVIGGKTYPTVVMPDGHEWLAVNLDYAWSGLSVPTSGASRVTTSQAMYYDYDEATYGWNGLKRGLLYNHYAVSYLETNKATLCPGWHVPTMDEFNALVTAIGGYNYGSKLKSTTGWKNNRNGTDEYGFAGYPSGDWSGSFSNINAYLSLWSTKYSNTSTPAVGYYYYLAYDSNNFDYSQSPRTSQHSVRLIKDY